MIGKPDGVHGPYAIGHPDRAAAGIVSYYGKTYVWVMPQHTKDFADFASVMLNIATWAAPPSSPKLSLTIAPITFVVPPRLNAKGLSEAIIGPYPRRARTTPNSKDDCTRGW